MKFLQFLRSFGLLIARLALGGILIAHGFMRWQVKGIPNEIAYVQQFGVPYPEVAAWGATILELVGGLFLIVGALTPLVALAVLVEQILIIAYITWRNGVYLVSSTGTYAGGYEYAVALAALSLIFVVFGGGGASIDRLFRRKKTEEVEPEPTPQTPNITHTPPVPSSLPQRPVGPTNAGASSASGPGASGPGASGPGASGPGASGPGASGPGTSGPANQNGSPVGASRNS